MKPEATNRYLELYRFVCVPLLIAMLGLTPSTLQASTIVVNTLDDIEADDGQCTLREAIIAANTNAASGASAGECAAGTAEDFVKLDVTGTLVLLSNLPQLTATQHLTGPGAYALTIFGNGQQMFVFSSPGRDQAFSLSGVTLTGGLSTEGGAVRLVSGDEVTLSQCVITGNISTGGGGGIALVNGPSLPISVLTIDECTIADNESQGAASGGGMRVGINSDVTIRNSTFSNNRATDVNGGGGGIKVFNSQSSDATAEVVLTVERSTFSGNEAARHGGGLSIDGPGIDATFASCTIVGNVADETEDDSGEGGGFSISEFAQVDLINTVVAQNQDLSPTGTVIPDLHERTGNGVYTTSGYNFIGDNTDVSGVFPASAGPTTPNGNDDYVGTSASPINPIMSGLVDNGGPTETHRPLINNFSPLVDAGSCSGETRDQRGYFDAGSGFRIVDRPDGNFPNADDGCDVGALEARADAPTVTVNARIFLEGAYGGGAMSTSASFDAARPLDQPYSDPVFDGTELEYDEAVSVVAFPANSIDWVLISLRSIPDAASELPGALQTAFVLANGNVVSLTGTALTFTDVTPGSYYVVVRHRNHMGVMSADPVDITSGTGFWNSSTAITQAYSSGGSPMKDVGGTFVLFAADGNADGNVTAPDFNLWNAATTSGATGYLPSDYNMDGNVTAPDFNLWNANTTAGAASQIP